MRRIALYGLGWLVAATAAMVLAWQGVGRVGTSFTDRHPRPFTAEETRQALAAAEPADGPSITTAPEGSAPTTGQSPTTTRQPRSTATTSRPSVSTAPTAATTATTHPVAPTPTATTNGVVRTYNLVGGSATLRFEPSGKVAVIWANPNPGFAVDVDERDGGGVRIRFDGDSHRSELEAWWDGQPRDDVRESGDDEGRSGPG